MAGRRSTENEFLPAALEIQVSPPSPAGRSVLWAIALIFAVSLLWACLGRIDMVAVARGKLIPSDHSKVIQPLETGIVRAIHVRDGQDVETGSALIELDPTASRAEHARQAKELAAARAQIARLRALLAGGGDLEEPEGAEPAFVALLQRMLRDQWSEHESRLEAARLLVEQRRAIVAATQADIDRLEATVPMLTERAEAFKTLLEGGFVARMQFLEIEEQRISRVQALAMQRERLVQDGAGLAEALKQAEALDFEFKRSRLGELADWEMRAASLEQEVVKAAQHSEIQQLTSPVDGVVQQLAVHTLGGVVTPAQPLMVIVPRDHPLEVDAWVENKDIGFVSVGQPVEVKLDTFPFTTYGTIPGKVLVVSRDAVQVDKVGLVYAARASLGRSTIPMDGEPVALLAGMSVSVEIKIGERRLIEFFLSPFLRHAREGLRER
jgi:hemolysin D